MCLLSSIANQLMVIFVGTWLKKCITDSFFCVLLTSLYFYCFHEILMMLYKNTDVF
jgi:hypothetical protein